jgi:type VI secretion system secreted protein Hcp
MPIYMKYDGIDGNIEVQGFEKHIEVTSFDFGVGRRLGSARGGSTREGTDATFSEVVVRKVTDDATVKFFEASVKGSLDKVVEVKFVRTGSDKPEAYLTFKLEDTGVAGLNFKAASGGGSDSRPAETIHLNFTKVTCEYNPIGDNLSGNPTKWGWDMQKSKAV